MQTFESQLRTILLLAVSCYVTYCDDELASKRREIDDRVAFEPNVYNLKVGTRWIQVFSCSQDHKNPLYADGNYISMYITRKTYRHHSTTILGRSKKGKGKKQYWTGCAKFQRIYQYLVSENEQYLKTRAVRKCAYCILPLSI